MASGLDNAVEQAIASATGENARIEGKQSIGGGCINNAQLLTMDDGRRLFLKSNANPLPNMFETEAEGLRALHNAKAIRIPEPICTGGGEGGVPHFIVMEYIESGSQRPGFQREMGRRFALLHQNTKQDQFGFEHDNYLGSTPQPNAWESDWVEFWRKHRLGHQLALARRNGLSDKTFDKLGEKLMERLDELIAEPREPACLLHGDLWGGNYVSDEKGDPVLIDPAAYYGRREADISMTTLFGGFSSDFYSGYEEVWPLEDGSKERIEIYKLYHLLNHLNLFGSSYYSGCLSIMRRYAG